MRFVIRNVHYVRNTLPACNALTYTKHLILREFANMKLVNRVTTETRSYENREMSYESLVPLRKYDNLEY